MLYGQTLTYGLDWDDYHFVRPYQIGEVTSSFVGPWDPIEAPFYRPVAVSFFALRAWILGDHTVALHALSLVMLSGLVGLLVAWWRALGVSLLAGTVAAILFLAHPLAAPSLVAWITNQMHLLQATLIAAALYLAAARPDRWRWLLGLQALAFGVKEDALILTPLIGVLWLVRGTSIPRGWLIGSVALVALLLGLRTWALAGAIGGYPEAPDVMNWGATLKALFVADWWWVRSLVATAAIVIFGTAAIASLRRDAWRAVLLPIAFVGLALAPLYFSSGPTRSHLVLIALATLVAVSLQHTRRPALMYGLAVGLVLALVPANHTAVAHFAPCSPRVLSHDTDVLTWGDAVPAVLRARLVAKTCNKVVPHKVIDPNVNSRGAR